MKFFKKRDTASTSEVTSTPHATTLPSLVDDDPIWEQPGPRSAYEVNHSIGYVDMGSVKLPLVPGMQIQTHMADDRQTIIRILVVIGNSGVQISVAAAPKSGGVWGEIYPGIISSMRADGATVKEVEGRYGVEIRANVPIVAQDGVKAIQNMRVLGIEGERWFARIDLLGPAAVDPEAGRNLERFIDRIVVVRDDKPRARLDLLPITAPVGVTPDAAGVEG